MHVPSLCRPHFPALKENFTVPNARTNVTIEVTDTEGLYAGEGILIGGGYYIITSIINSTDMTVMHNGLGATAGLLMVAVHPAYGCYQYPIIPVGRVTLDTTPLVVGLAQEPNAEVAGSIVSLAVQSLVYGFLGPTSFEFTAEVVAEIANSPYWIGIELPNAVRATAPAPVFSSFIQLTVGADPTSGVATVGSDAYSGYIIVGPGGGTAFTNGPDRRVIVSGRCEILL